MVCVVQQFNNHFEILFQFYHLLSFVFDSVFKVLFVIAGFLSIYPTTYVQDVQFSSPQLRLGITYPTIYYTKKFGFCLVFFY